MFLICRRRICGSRRRSGDRNTVIVFLLKSCFCHSDALVGDVVYVENLGNPMIFINSYHAAVELLEKRSSIYSSRPRIVMSCELCVVYQNSMNVVGSTRSREGWDWLTIFMPYGDRLRKHRSTLHHFLQPAVVADYFSLQLYETHRTLDRLMSSPDKFLHHLRK